MPAFWQSGVAGVSGNMVENIPMLRTEFSVLEDRAAYRETMQETTGNRHREVPGNGAGLGAFYRETVQDY
jgi:hypothetical protein